MTPHRFTPAAFFTIWRACSFFYSTCFFLATLATLATVATVATSVTAAAEAPLVHLADIDPTIRQEVRYASSNNFIGRPIRGYGAATILISPQAAAALAKAQAAAKEHGLSLLVYDAYRPQRAVDDFVKWAADLEDTGMKSEFYPQVPKSELFERGYIAERSGHSRGSTVDLTLARDGVPLDMGTPFDWFGERSHTEHPSVRDSALKNRFLLRRIMEDAGFKNYAQEWWHFTLRDEPYPDTYFDIPIEE